MNPLAAGVPLLVAASVVAVAWAAGWLGRVDPHPLDRLVSQARPGAAPDRWPYPRSLARQHEGGREGGDGSGRPPAWLVGATVALVGAVALVVGPGVAVVATASIGLARVRAAMARKKTVLRAVDGAVPDLVDLLSLAAAAGHPVNRCLRLVAPRAPTPLRAAMVIAVDELDQGFPLSEVLGRLGPSLGTLGPSVTGAMSASALTGAPLVPTLDRVVLLARDRRRRDAEARARKLPVTMLFPLVACVLPAFVLLAVVPLLAASLASLRL